MKAIRKVTNLYGDVLNFLSRCLGNCTLDLYIYHLNDIVFVYILSYAVLIYSILSFLFSVTKRTNVISVN
jgi:hypothetical protein